MDCVSLADERLSGDKMDVLYGEADADVRARVESHLAACPACRDEMAALGRLRGELRSWRLPRPRPRFTPRGIVVPRWLAAAAALLLGVGIGLSGTGYASLRRALAEQQARATALEQEQRRAQAALAEILARPAAAAPAGEIEARLAERIRASEARLARTVDLRLAGFGERVAAQRQVDLARVAQGLTYLDSQHGQQLARTNELMGYVLQAAAQPR